MFATLKDHNKCPKCGGLADWRSKSVWLSYEEREVWSGYEGNIELDENMNGEIVAYGLDKEVKLKDGTKGCGHITYYKIRKGKLIESTEKEYQNYVDK